MSTLNRNLLVVDDEDIIREMLVSVFGELNYKVFSAASAEEAVDLLDKNTIRVMFLDIQLPGMSGIELCQKARERNENAVIYAMTGYTRLFQVGECREVGFDDYFTKPFQLSDLVKAAEDAFEKIDRWAEEGDSG